MIPDQNTCFTIFYPTASATAYGRRPKFFRAEHSATAEGENCAYGPTLVFTQAYRRFEYLGFALSLKFQNLKKDNCREYQSLNLILIRKLML